MMKETKQVGKGNRLKDIFNLKTRKTYQNKVNM